MAERATIGLALVDAGFFDSLWFLALVTAVGTFLLTFILYRIWTSARRAVTRARRAAGRFRTRDVDDVPRVGGGEPEPSPAASGTATARGGGNPVPRENAAGSLDEDWDDHAFASASGEGDGRGGGRAPSAATATRAEGGSGPVTVDGRRIHAPRERSQGAPNLAGAASRPRVETSGGDEAPAWEDKKKRMALNEWERLVEDVMSRESILARSRGRLSKRRSLQSLLSSIRDRDLLHERGHRIGKAIYSKGYTELGDRLQRNHVCEEAVFRKGKGDRMEIRLIGTAMAKEAPVIGTPVCFMEAGLLAGAIENLEDVPHEVREVKCVVKGDPFCEFTATPRPEAVEKSWVDDPSGLTEGGEEA